MSFLNKEFFFVRFPMHLPILYFLSLIIFPQHETFILISAILILAEPHFGATWLIFLNKANYHYINENRLKLIYGTLFVFIFSLTGFFYFKYTFLLIFFAANLFHVARQSIGVIKLYNQSNTLNEMIYINYFFAITYFFIGLTRFYIPLISDTNLIYINILIIFLFIVAIFYLKIKKTNLKDLLTFITGIIIFYPICFVGKPVHAIIMGVTMHYSQYLYFTYLINKGRNLNESNKSSVNSYFFFFLISYGFLMTSLTFIGKYDSDILKNLIIIPIIGQMVHFYIDSFIWRFSEKHNRDVSLKYIKT
jgi:hypothetical protein